MAKTSIQQFSTTASSNTDIDGINVNTGWSPANVGPAFRELMALLASALVPLSMPLSGSSVTLSAAQASAQAIFFTGSLSGACTVVLENTPFFGSAQNGTSGGQNIVLVAGTGVVLTVPPDGNIYYYVINAAGDVVALPMTVGALLSLGPIVGTNDGANALAFNAANGLSILQAASGSPPASTALVLSVRNVSGFLAVMQYGGSPVGSINTNSTTTSYNTTSDATLKIDDGLMTFEDAARIVRRLKPRWFRFKSEAAGEKQPGFFAQELARPFRWAVTRGRKSGGVYHPWQADASKLMPAVIAYIQGLEHRIAELEGR